jgi:hypothetical protein
MSQAQAAAAQAAKNVHSFTKVMQQAQHTTHARANTPCVTSSCTAASARLEFFATFTSAQHAQNADELYMQVHQ